MIVVATHNGQQFIDNHLQSWNEYGTHGHSVAVVATGASSPEYTDYLRRLASEKWGFRLFICSTPYAGYDTGAYIWAYKHFHQEEEFLFCHDSMVVKKSRVMWDFQNMALDNKAGCVPWLVFRLNSYESEEQWNLVQQIVPNPSIHPSPGFGIFGPIFYTTRTSLRALPPATFQQYPTNKNQQEAMERGWSAIFDRSGITMVPLEGDFYESDALADRYSYFQKFLPKRQ